MAGSSATRISAVLVFGLWAVLALLSLAPIATLLNGAFPIFTAVWIVVPLFVVVRSRDADRVGFRRVPPRLLLETAAVNLALFAALMLAFEPWSHTYQKLLDVVLASQPPDTTFAWLVRYPRLPALAAMFAYSGLVTLFGEELFFRGWLLQWLRRRMAVAAAILCQAILFTLPQALAATFLPPLQGILYVVVYSALTIGIVGGWAAARTNSIWPSLVTAAVGNLTLVALLT